MDLVCPGCAMRSLRIQCALELPANACYDEVQVQALTCSQCGLLAVGAYQESRRGALGDESVHHGAYALTQTGMQRLLALLQDCPEPDNPGCGCAAHQVFEGGDLPGILQRLGIGFLTYYPDI